MIVYHVYCVTDAVYVTHIAHVEDATDADHAVGVVRAETILCLLVNEEIKLAHYQQAWKQREKEADGGEKHPAEQSVRQDFRLNSEKCQRRPFHACERHKMEATDQQGSAGYEPYEPIAPQTRRLH